MAVHLKNHISEGYVQNMTNRGYGDYNLKDAYVKYKSRGTGTEKTFELKKYTSYLYIPGNFTKSYNKIVSYKSNPPIYNVLFNNCAHLSLIFLQQSTSGNQWVRIQSVIGGVIRNVLVPNTVYYQIPGLFTVTASKTVSSW